MKYKPESKKELQELVDNLDINLGDIDVSNITDMRDLFYETNRIDFSGIENWDVSNVKDISGMFYNSQFNGDISNWNVSNVEDMFGMFYNSQFNGNISKWNVSKAYNSNGIRFMFYDTYIPENHKPKLLQEF